MSAALHRALWLLSLPLTLPLMLGFLIALAFIELSAIHAAGKGA